jgi:hypothetical protein
MRCRLYKRRENFWMKRKMHERLTLDDEQILNPIITRLNYHKFVFVYLFENTLFRYSFFIVQFSRLLIMGPNFS